MLESPTAVKIENSSKGVRVSIEQRLCQGQCCRVKGKRNHPQG